MWNYMGWDNASTVAREVDNPRRNYPRAMLASAAVVAVSYIVPLAAAAWAGVPADSFSTGSWADVARTLVGPWLGLAIVIGGTLTAVGMFNALTMSYARLPMVLAEDRHAAFRPGAQKTAATSPGLPCSPAPSPGLSRCASPSSA